MSDVDLAGMDPQARRFLAMVAVGASEASAVSIEDRRASFEKLMGMSRASGGAANLTTVDLSIPTCGYDLPIRRYDPDPSRPFMPGLLYFHGGGLVAGSIETHDALCRSLAFEAGCRVLSIRYRLAPEHPFPTAIIDALAAARAITRHAETFGLDRAHIAIGGDSGGATLATIVAQILRRRALFQAQVLLCPVLDFVEVYPSKCAFGDGFLLDKATMARDLEHYAAIRSPADPRISPLQEDCLDGLPPTIIHTAGFDPLRDEGAAYAARLKEAGVRVTFNCHATLIHHFYGLTGVIPAARGALSAIALDLKEALA